MKVIFAKGLFIKNDDNGNPCNVGDIVQVTRPEMNWSNLSDDLDHQIHRDEEIWTGILCLLKSRGVQIKTSTGYIKPNLTNRGYNTWKWKLILKK